MLKIQSRFRTKWVILGQSRTICGNVVIRKSQRLDKVEFILYIYMTIDNYDGGFFRYRDRLTNRSHDCQAIQCIFAIHSEDLDADFTVSFRRVQSFYII